MPIEGISNLLPREPRPPVEKRQARGEMPTDTTALRAETEPDLKGLLAARLERVRAHAANMRTYTERAKVQLDNPGSSDVDVRA